MSAAPLPNDCLQLENIKGMVDWYRNRRILARNRRDLAGCNYLKNRELHYSGILNSLENKLTKKVVKSDSN